MSILRPEPSCTVQAYQEGGDYLLVFLGVLRLQNSETIKAAVIELLEREVRDIFADLSGLLEVDSAGLGVLVGMHMTARKKKVPFYIVAPAPFQMRLFESTRLDSVFNLLTTSSDVEELRGRMLTSENQVADIFKAS